MNGIRARFTGRVAHEPELRYTSSGKRLLKFTWAQAGLLVAAVRPRMRRAVG